MAIDTLSSLAPGSANRRTGGSPAGRVRGRGMLLGVLASLAVTALPALGATYRYVDWTSADPAQGTAAGTLTLQDGSTVDVSFRAFQPNGSPGQLYGAQTSGGTNYWTPAGTYTGAEVGNAPPASDIIQLAGAQTYVITLSKDVPDPIISIVSLGKPGAPANYKFSTFAPYTLLSQGPGYFGDGSLSKSGSVLTGAEGNGTIQLQGMYSTIGWSALEAEVWNGFTLGIRVDDASPPPGPPGTGDLSPLTGIVSVGAGSHHVCAVTNAGGVLCWGDGTVGELGDGSDVGRITPVYVTGLGSGAAAVAVGMYHACALTVSGGVKCWGINSAGQLGDGTTEDRSTPVDVVGLTSGVTAITTHGAFGQHTCALLAGGGVKCWGANAYGQLGDGSTENRSSPVAVVGLASNVASISAGGSHTCAVTNGGEGKCWGDNFLGAVGNVAITRQPLPVSVTGVGAALARIAAGGRHSCALTVSGALRCWGININGALGNGTTISSVEPVSVIGLGANVTAVALGDEHSCALLAGGAMKCWGYNFRGEVGDGTNTNRLAPVAVTGLGSGVSLVAAGLAKTCAVAGGTLKCWSDNRDGGLGDGSDPYASLPTNVVGLASGVAAVAAGANHGCALAAGGAAKCWGNNLSAALGDGTTTDRSTPVAVVGIANGATAIGTGDSHSCAVTGAGGVKCWGSNFQGKLGDGSATPLRSTPVDVSGLTSGVATVSVGYFHTCALTTGGAVLCWGSNLDGALGDGTTVSRSTPVAVAGLGNGVVAIAAGGFHTCALTAAGGVKCWGRNSSGALGDGSADKRVVPVDVLGLASGVAAIAAGRDHSCARTAAGALKCWGWNGEGELGDGTSIQRNAPVDVLGLASGVGAIAAGMTHTCAVVGGALHCWGDNASGQLGDGTRYSRFVPAAVAGLAAGVTQVSAGRLSTCAVTAAGEARCWGFRWRGLLGDGAPEFWRAIPDDVVVAAPDRLAVVQLNDGLPIMAGQPFSVKVETRNAGSAGPLQTAASIELELTAGIGPLLGTAGCVIPAGVHQCTIAGLTLGQGQAGAVLTARRASGASLVDGSSAAFSVFGAATPLPGVDGNFQGLWWADPPGSESGWGINFAHQGDIIFATWFTYDANGDPHWLAMVAVRTAPGVYEGDLFTTTGPAFNAVPFLPSNVQETTVGHATLTFTGPKHARFEYTLSLPAQAKSAVAQTKNITLQEFAAAPACTWNPPVASAFATNYQDLWWNIPEGSESGWGINLTHQGDTIFATWFTYDAQGKPWWLAFVADKTGAGTYAGDVFTAKGPPFSAVPFDPATVVETVVGNARLTFAGGNLASFEYTVNGIAQTKLITRQVFVAPGTVCQ